MPQTCSTPSRLPLAQLHALFLAILPQLRQHGRGAFRHLSPDAQEESLAEMLALTWKWLPGILEKGKDPREFPFALASFAARAVRGGRRLCGQERASDVLSPRAQVRHGFRVRSVWGMDAGGQGILAESLSDPNQPPIPEEVSLRLDFPRWRRRQPNRMRKVVSALLRGEKANAVARTLSLSPARLCQLRRQLREDYRLFHASQA